MLSGIEGMVPIRISFGLQGHPTTTLDLSEEGIIVGGKNGTGKTTLLDAIHRMSQILSKESLNNAENYRASSWFRDHIIREFSITYKNHMDDNFGALPADHFVRFDGPDFSESLDEHDFIAPNLFSLIEIGIGEDVSNQDKGPGGIFWRNGLRLEFESDESWEKIFIAEEQIFPQWNLLTFALDSIPEFNPSSSQVDNYREKLVESEGEWINVLEWNERSQLSLDREKHAEARNQTAKMLMSTGTSDHLRRLFLANRPFLPPRSKKISIERDVTKKDRTRIMQILPGLNRIHENFISDTSTLISRIKQMENQIIEMMIDAHLIPSKYWNPNPDSQSGTIDFNIGKPHLDDPMGLVCQGSFPSLSEGKEYLIMKITEYAIRWYESSDKFHHHRDRWFYSKPQSKDDIKFKASLEIPSSEGQKVRLPRALSHRFFRNLYYGSDVSSIDAEIIAAIDTFEKIERFNQYPTSGQEQIVQIVASVANTEPNTLILIDEPELSLHVDWQIKFIDNLLQLTDEKMLIVATHSPDICLNHLDMSKALEFNVDYLG